MEGRKKTDFTKGPLRRHIFTMSFPLVWGVLAVIMLQLTDIFFVGRLENTNKLAAISFTFPLTMLVGNLFFGFTVAVTSRISRLIGGKEQGDPVACYTHACLLTILATSSMAGLLLLFLGEIVVLVGAPEALISDILLYLRYWLVGSVFFYTAVMSNGAMRAFGDSSTPVYLMFVAVLANMILDPILIFGLFGGPRMEVEGAAIASLAASVLLFLLTWFVMATRKRLLDFCAFANNAVMKENFSELIQLAIPAGFTHAIKPLTTTIIMTLVATHGAEAVAAYGVVSRIEAFAFLISLALTLGITPIIGQNWGAGQYQRVSETLRLSIIYSSLWAVSAALLLGAFAPYIASLFSSDPEVIRIAAFYLAVVPVTALFTLLISAWSSAFNAIGTPEKSLLMVGVHMFALAVPLAWVGSITVGIEGIWVAIAASNILAGLGFHLYNRKALGNMQEAVAAE